MSDVKSIGILCHNVKDSRNVEEFNLVYALARKIYPEPQALKFFTSDPRGEARLSFNLFEPVKVPYIQCDALVVQVCDEESPWVKNSENPKMIKDMVIALARNVRSGGYVVFSTLDTQEQQDVLTDFNAFEVDVETADEVIPYWVLIRK